jgi:hypothetical protein
LRRLFLRNQFFQNFFWSRLHGRSGYVASWRPLYGGQGAIKVIGSPFKSFEEAESACDAMLKNLMSDWLPVPGRRRAHTRQKSKQVLESIRLPAGQARR